MQEEEEVYTGRGHQVPMSGTSLSVAPALENQRLIHIDERGRSEDVRNSIGNELNRLLIWFRCQPSTRYEQVEIAYVSHWSTEAVVPVVWIQLTESTRVKVMSPFTLDNF